MHFTTKGKRLNSQHLKISTTNNTKTKEQ